MCNIYIFEEKLTSMLYAQMHKQKGFGSDNCFVKRQVGRHRS